MKRIFSSIVAATLMTGAVHAQDMFSAKDPQAITDLISSMGFAATLGTDAIGDPLISASSNGLDWDVYFWDCLDNTDCDSIQFYTGFDLVNGMSADKINEWNANNRYVRAYLDSENDPLFEMDLTTIGGVTQGNLTAHILTWVSMLEEIDRFTD